MSAGAEIWCGSFRCARHDPPLCGLPHDLPPHPQAKELRQANSLRTSCPTLVRANQPLSFRAMRETAKASFEFVALSRHPSRKVVGTGLSKARPEAILRFTRIQVKTLDPPRDRCGTCGHDVYRKLACARRRGHRTFTAMSLTGPLPDMERCPT